MKNLRGKKDFLRDWLVWLALLGGMYEMLLWFAYILHTPKKNDSLEVTWILVTVLLLLYSLLTAAQYEILVSRLMEAKRIWQIMVLVVVMFNLLCLASYDQVMTRPTWILGVVLFMVYAVLVVIFATVCAVRRGER